MRLPQGPCPGVAADVLQGWVVAAHHLVSPLCQGPFLTSRSTADFPVGFPMCCSLRWGLGLTGILAPFGARCLTTIPLHRKGSRDFPGVQVVRHPPCKAGAAGPIVSLSD